jgi:hypothetical protein
MLAGRMTPDETSQPAQRTSLMALVALGLSLMCPVPMSGLCGALMGGIALRRIGASGGRLSGGGPAKVAVVLGVIVTAMQMFVLFGVAQSWTFYKKQMLPIMDEAVVALVSLEVHEDQELWSQGFLESVEVSRLSGVRDRLGLWEGAGARVRIGGGEMWRSFRTLFRSASVRAGGGGGVAAPQAVPFGLVVGDEEYFGWFFFDSVELENGLLLVEDVLIEIDDGTALTLLVDGAASELATGWLGWELLAIDGEGPSS